MNVIKTTAEPISRISLFEQFVARRGIATPFAGFQKTGTVLSYLHYDTWIIKNILNINNKNS